MSEAKSIEDIDDVLIPTADVSDLPDERTKPTIDKDTRRRLEDALEERRLKKAIEDDFAD
ncbi:MAG: PA3496 family putative envelope integrity protein [Halothiobacillaceae bacterium]